MCRRWLRLNPQTKPTSQKHNPCPREPANYHSTPQNVSRSTILNRWLPVNQCQSINVKQSMSMNQSISHSIIQSNNECGTQVRLITEKPIHSLHCKDNESCGCTENNCLGCRETNCFHFNRGKCLEFPCEGKNVARKLQPNHLKLGEMKR